MYVIDITRVCVGMFFEKYILFSLDKRKKAVINIIYHVDIEFVRD